jgi:hypothetical protein
VNESSFTNVKKFISDKQREIHFTHEKGKGKKSSGSLNANSSETCHDTTASSIC